MGGMALFRCTYSGTFNNGEQWSTGHWIQTTTNEDAFDLSGDVGDIYKSSPFNIAGMLAPGDTVEKLSVYKYADPNAGAVDQAEYIIGEGPNGTLTKVIPSQLSVCVTLRTGAPGASRRGRMFLPCRVQEVLDLEGALKVADGGSLISGMAAYMGSVNIAGLRHCVVVSRKTGEVRNIRTVEVGTIVDTQRRRRNGLVESRQSSNVSQI
jgi:hypothetical protein